MCRLRPTEFLSGVSSSIERPPKLSERGEAARKLRKQDRDAERRLVAAIYQATFVVLERSDSRFFDAESRIDREDHFLHAGPDVCTSVRCEMFAIGVKVELESCLIARARSHGDTLLRFGGDWADGR